MRTHPLLLSALFLAAVSTTARSQPAAPASTATPAAPAAAAPAAAEEKPAPAEPPASDVTIKDSEPAHTGITAKGKDGASKDTLSVDFPDEDIRNVLRNVADLFELNLVMPDTLQGKTSVKLRDVTWRQIFEVVLKQVGYTFIEKDNIVKIVSINDLQGEPFITRTFIFENVTASKIKPLVDPMLTPKRDPDPKTQSAGTPSGSIVVNDLANELIVTDQSTVIARIGDMIKRLDTEPKQVVIETKFVEISKDDTKNREISMGYKNSKTGLDVRTGVGVGPGSNTATPFTINSGSLLGGSPTAIFNQDEFSALINIMNSATNVRLVTNPTIVAINGTKSDIKIGRDLQLVTVTTTTSGSTPVTTATAGDIKFVGISLEVTPQITGSKLIALKIKPSKSSIFTARTISGNTFYDIDKREGDLNVILRDGQTAAIGGLVDTTTRKIATKFPLLGDIPLLGSLFKTTTDSVDVTNLIIFITATVLEPSKMKYENVVSKEQLNDLELTPRGIGGKGYTRPEEETALLERVGIVRQEKEDAAALKALHKSAVTPSKYSK